MSNRRLLVFADGELYHVYNRGVERRPIFTNKREHERMRELLWYYRFADIPKSFSKYNKLSLAEQQTIAKNLQQANRLGVSLVAYCLMPNHFHLLLRQVVSLGIRRYVSNVCNGYTKYFNTKHHRVGPLLQGTFKAVRIETDEQLLHVSRYIHLNPVSSFLVSIDQLELYPWSSYPIYLGKEKQEWVETETVLGQFSSVDSYWSFVTDQAAYVQSLESIKHLMLEKG